MIRLLLCCFLLLGSGALVAQRPGYVTVLLYHRFAEPQYASTNVSVQNFRSQLTYLRDEGYQVLSLSDLRRLYAAGGPFPQKSVLITIDDAHRSIYQHGFPVLKEFGYPFVLFPNVKPLSSGAKAHMNWEMIEEMRQFGAEIGNHTYSHPYIGRPRSGQNRQQYATWVRQEIEQAQRELQAHGIDTDVLAYPYGEYNSIVVDEAQKLGFKLMFTQDEGGMDAASAAALLPRVAVVGANLDLPRFIYKLNLAPLHLSELIPEGDFLSHNPPDSLAVRLADPGRYNPGVVNMFVSEWGRVEAVYEAQTGRLVYKPVKEMSRAGNRLIVTARELDSAHYSMFSRLYFLPFEDLAR